jgi:phosphoglycolate phosphatase-like HAD superfamily hydrolase
VKKHPGSVASHPFDESFVRAVYAAADFLFMPSRFEPSGLSQLISQRYGTLPIVTRTGGLVDTVRDLRDDAENGDGIFIRDFSVPALVEAAEAAIAGYRHPGALDAARATAMAKEASWAPALDAYEALFRGLAAGSAPKRPDAVLFDWDGTLSDDQAVNSAVVAEVFKRLGFAMPPAEEVERVWRTDKIVFYERFFPGVARETVDKTYYGVLEAARRGEELGGRRFDRIPLLPGALALLKSLKARGVRLAVVSNKPEKALLLELEKSGTLPYFEYVQGLKDGREGKPSPQPILEALGAMGLPAGNVWYVGNELTDMQAAGAAGAKPVLIGRSSKAAVIENGRGADPAQDILFVDGHRELNSIVRKLPRRRS